MDANEIDGFVARAAQGDPVALTTLLEGYRDQLKRMVGLRLDRRLQGRIDASDVVQEVMIEAARRLSDYADDPPMDFFFWLRCLTADRLCTTHREHLGTQKRDASLEVSLYRRPMPEASSASLAQHLLGQLTSPSQAVNRAELQLLVQNLLNDMDPMDREILVLRNFEQLTTAQAARELGIKRSTAGKRYIAALKRLKQALSSIPGLEEQIQ